MGDHGFEPMVESTYKIDTCRFLARCSVLIGQGKDWLAQDQDNVTEWDIKSWYWRSGFPVGQHYEIAMCAHCHKSEPVLI